MPKCPRGEKCPAGVIGNAVKFTRTMEDVVALTRRRFDQGQPPKTLVC